MEEKIIVSQEAPPDTSTYFDGKVDIKEEPMKEGTGSFSFLDAIEEARLYE